MRWVPSEPSWHYWMFARGKFQRTEARHENESANEHVDLHPELIEPGVQDQQGKLRRAAGQTRLRSPTESLSGNEGHTCHGEEITPDATARVPPSNQNGESLLAAQKRRHRGNLLHRLDSVVAVIVTIIIRVVSRFVIAVAIGR